MKKILLVLLTAVMSVGIGAEALAQGDKKTDVVVFETNIHCNNCKKRIEDSLPFEKGVKDVVIDVEKKTVAVTYDRAKTDEMKLRRAVEKLGYKAEVSKAATEDKK